MGAGVDYYYCLDQEPTEWMEFDVKLVVYVESIPTKSLLNTDFYKIPPMGDERATQWKFKTFIQGWRDEFMWFVAELFS